MTTKTSLITTAAALALFSSANGQVVIDIAGSTAGRSTIHTLLSTAATSPLGTGVKFKWYKVDGTTSSASSADGVIYKGTYLGQPTIVRTYWAGSASGVDIVSNQVQMDNKLLSTSVDTTTANAQLAGDAVALAASLADASPETVAEFGFSDVKQASTPHQTNPLVEQTDMFVIPFKWVKTNDPADVTPSAEDIKSITNITDQAARALFTAGGRVSKAFFTGLTGDANTEVYAVGRDSDSGTRICAFAEIGAGVFTPLSQWKFTVTGTEPNTVISSPVEVFDGGELSGGGVANMLAGTGFNAIGYVGVSDAATAIGNGAVELTFNGVPFSVENIKKGSYTYWSKYQALRKKTLTGPDANAGSFFTLVKSTLTGLATTGNGSLVKLTDMQCTRASDGADVLSSIELP